MKKVSYMILAMVLLLLSAGLAKSSWGACAGASPNLMAADASYAEVNACTAASTHGDTITIPAGSKDWGNNTLTITKGVWLKGAGVGQTIINWRGTGISAAISFVPDATSRTDNTTVFKVTGLEIHGPGNVDSSNSAISPSDYNTDAFEKIMIGNNKFVNFRNGVYASGNIYGVVYSNQFVDVGIIGRGIGANQDSLNNHPFSYGDANQLYFEDNTISFTVDPATASAAYGTNGGDYGWVEGGQGGRIAIRYNTYDYTNCISGVIMIDQWDLHGAAGGTGFGTMGAEFYGNKQYNDQATQPPDWGGWHTRRWMYHRGGKLLMFDNDWEYVPPAVPGIGLINEVDTPGYNQYINDSYYWSNLANGTNVVASLNSDCCNEVKENEQFFNYHDPELGAQAHGVGCGILANRPEACTTGVGYWATNQSCSNLTGMVGVNPATPISGTLYKCTAPNTWTAYYTPYTYPHPLRVGADTTPPAAPTGLAVK